MKLSSARIFGAATVVLLLTTSCGSSAGNTAASSTGTANASSAATGPTAGSIAAATTGSSDRCTPDRAGGEITMGVFTLAPGLDPVSPSSEGVYGGSELTALYDTLTTFDTGTASYVPRLAESLEPDANYTTWTMTLRPDITFGNGDPMTADSVKTSIERHLSPDNKDKSRALAGNIAAMTAVNPTTLEFTLTEPWPGFPYLLATDVGMITENTVVTAMGVEEFNKNPQGAGAGPYEVTAYAPGEELVLTAKPDYWDGPVCIQQLRFVSVQGAQGTYDAFRNNELDVAFLREPQVVAQARTDGYPDLPTLFGATEAVVMNSGAGLSTAPITADVRVRNAVVAALDLDQVNQRVFDGSAIPSSTLVPNTAGPAFADLTGITNDPELARQLVNEVKAEGWDGTIRLLADKSPTHVQESITVEAQLEAVGFQVASDNSVDIPTLSKHVVVDGDFDLAIFGPNYAPEGLWARIAPRPQSSAPTNYFHYANPDMDTALAALKTAATVSEEKQAIKTIQQVWNDTAPGAVLAAYEEDVVYHDNVKGLILTRSSIIRFDKAYLEN